MPRATIKQEYVVVLPERDSEAYNELLIRWWEEGAVDDLDNVGKSLHQVITALGQQEVESQIAYYMIFEWHAAGGFEDSVDLTVNEVIWDV